MKCAKCKNEVSIADRTCPNCGNDLLQFGSTVFYEPKEKDSNRYGQGIKDMVFGDLHRNLGDNLSTLDPGERRVLLPIEKRFKSLIRRHLSDGEIEVLFDKEIIPTIDDISQEKDAEKILLKIEGEIKQNLGDTAFNHYKIKGQEVLKILRAGEIAYFIIPLKDIDLSVKMFPFFKASEKSCWLHTRTRYQEMRSNPLIRDLAEWLGNNKENLYIENIPDWLVDRKNTLIEVINGILTQNEYFLGGSLRTGISLYVLGRKWIIKIERRDLSKMKEFQITNILQTNGDEREIVLLSENLCRLQVLRNKRVHDEIESDDEQVKENRALSYSCLKTIPEILKI